MADRNPAETWRTATDPFVLLDALFPMRSPDSVEPQGRAARLYWLACARRVWVFLPWVCRALVEVAERLVDGEEVGDALRSAAAFAAEELTHCHGDLEAIAEVERGVCGAGLVRSPDGRPEASYDAKTWAAVAHLTYYPYAAHTPNFRLVPRECHSVRLIREVFGDPYRRPGAFPPGWRTGVVTTLAREMYRSRDFSPMPILRDALLDAGCDDEPLLDHCRHGDRHVRGCWAIERILRG